MRAVFHFDVAIRASQGARRGQEDTALAWPAPADGLEGTSRDTTTPLALPAASTGEVVAVLCDGMGGHAGGAMAGRLACEAFLHGAVTDGDRTATLVRTRLFDALNEANAALADKIADNTSYRGMGSTLVGVHIGAEGLTWISVGDSLLYLWRDSHVVPLNADHSLAPEIDKLAESGKISWAQAQADPRRHYLRSALTGDDIEMIDLSERAAPLLPGDVVVLASDGIHTLEEARIAAIITQCAAAGAEAIASRLISTVDAEHAPHQDNTTVVVIQVSLAKPRTAADPDHV